MSAPSDTTLSASEWVRRGRMRVLRAALPEDDPESWPTLWHERFGEEMPRWARLEVGCAVEAAGPCPTCGAPPKGVRDKIALNRSGE